MSFEWGGNSWMQLMLSALYFFTAWRLYRAWRRARLPWVKPSLLMLLVGLVLFGAWNLLLALFSLPFWVHQISRGLNLWLILTINILISAHQLHDEDVVRSHGRGRA